MNLFDLLKDVEKLAKSVIADDKESNRSINGPLRRIMTHLHTHVEARIKSDWLNNKIPISLNRLYNQELTPQRLFDKASSIYFGKLSKSLLYPNYEEMSVIKDDFDALTKSVTDLQKDAALKMPQTQTRTDIIDEELPKPDDFFGDRSTVISKDHAHPNFKDHHTDLLDDIDVGRTVKSMSKGQQDTFTTRKMFVGKYGSNEPKLLIKAPVDYKNFERYNMHHHANDPHRISHLLHPTFMSTHREAAYSKAADHVFGLGHYVPRTTVFVQQNTKTGMDETWSAMEFKKGARHFDDAYECSDEMDTYAENGDLFKKALMNVVMGNCDRHMNNTMISDDGHHLIDNGFAFDYGKNGGYFHAPEPFYARDHSHAQIPLDLVHKWVNSLNADKLGSILKQSGAPDEITEIAKNRLLDTQSLMNRFASGELDERACNLRTFYDHIRMNELGKNREDIVRQQEGRLHFHKRNKDV